MLPAPDHLGPTALSASWRRPATTPSWGSISIPALGTGNGSFFAATAAAGGLVAAGEPSLGAELTRTPLPHQAPRLGGLRVEHDELVFFPVAGLGVGAAWTGKALTAAARLRRRVWVPLGAPGAVWWPGRWGCGGFCLQGPQGDAQRLIAGERMADMSAVFLIVASAPDTWDTHHLAHGETRSGCLTWPE